MSRAIQIAGKPFVKIYAVANARINGISGPLKQQIDSHNASGEDLCAGVWKEYFTWQRELISYRKEKLLDELTLLKSGKVSFATLTYKDVIIALRVMTKYLFILLIFTILGRGTVFPLLLPTSPFLEEVALWQPNHKRHLNIGDI